MKRLKSLMLLGVTIATLGLVTGCSGNSNNEVSKDEAQTRIVQSVKGEVEIPADPKKNS